ncbi:hypothetical protein COV16_06535 [Candidatus Woesearchaeota archaeon CG10_big_fil_rev_8_21_14_0_10_34_8]|nr:MAG: hypothetical protein COV16_06535 [Candidatus Woesearchaeota archaeon CG10_big_fil_rev_8_21_14_0_10_34_8]
MKVIDKQLNKFLNALDRINNEKMIIKCLNKTKNEYKLYDPGNYLYRKLNQNYNKNDLFSDEYLKLVYVTLCAWNMNTRGARLTDFETFVSLLRQNEKLICQLSDYKIKEFKEKELKLIEELFFNLKYLCKQKSKIVTFSKTMHFLLPHLIVPIDRKYTLSFLKNNVNIPNDIKRQFELYKNIFLAFSLFSKTTDLTEYIDNNWNQNIPKILDNIVIGYEKLK